MWRSVIAFPSLNKLQSLNDVVPPRLQSYIDFEIAEGERGRTRELYERLLQRTHHVKVWMSYAAFEASPLPEPEGEEPAENNALANRGEEAPERRETAARRYG